MTVIIKINFAKPKLIITFTISNKNIMKTMITINQSVHYTDIKTFEDACNFLDVNPEKFEKATDYLPINVYAYMQLTIISQALNGGTNMNYDDTDEYKYYPYFYAKGSSSGFSYDVYGYGRTFSIVASRLAYKSGEIAKYAGEQFLSIYDRYING